MKIIDNLTGEVLEEKEENLQLAKKEFYSIANVDNWLEKKEALETAKEQFEMVDKPFRKLIKELFEKYQIHRLTDDYIDILLKNGYQRSSWDDEKLNEFIIQSGLKPEQFKKDKWIDGTIQIKYKE